MGPISKSAKKSKTPGPDGKKKAGIMDRKAMSEGGPIKKSKVTQSATKAGKANKTPKKSGKAADEKVKLAFGEDSDEENTKMLQKTPVGAKGKKTPKSGKKKQEPMEESSAVTPKGKTPKGAATPKGKTPKGAAQKAMSEGKKAPKSASKKGSDAGAKESLKQTPKVKTPGGGKKEPASAKKNKKGDGSPVKQPFDVEDDYDEEEDEDFDMDDSEDDSGSGSDDSSDGEFDSDDDDDDDGVLDDDDEDEDFDEDEEESSSVSDESDMSFESDDVGSDDDEISFNPTAKKGAESPKKQKTPKGGKTQEMTKILPKSKEEKKSKTPKSALKPPGTGAGSDKKVSIVVTSPEQEEKSSKKVVSTPHPSGTKKRRPDENDKEIVDENGVSSKKGKKGKAKRSSESEGDEEPLQKQLSFEDKEEEKGGKKTTKGGKGKGQAEKRKLEDSGDEDDSDDDEGGEEMGEMKPDGIYYHVGNLPPNVQKKDVEWFLAEEDVEPARIIIKREKVVRTELTGIKKSKKKYRKRETKIQHCYAILECKSKEDAEKLDNMNGTEFTAPDGLWREYIVAIYPIMKQQATEQQGNGVMQQNCVHIRPLNNKMGDDALQQFFVDNGVTPVNVRIARRGVRQISKGFAFAWFSNRGDAKKAIGLSGKKVQGFTLNITQAKPKVQGPKKYNYKIGSNLDIKAREKALAEATKKRKNFPKKKVKTV